MKLLITLIFCIPFILVNSQLGCRDENGNEVDWYYLFKLPTNLNESTFKEGKEYIYLTSKESSEWQRGQKTIDNSESFPGQTLKQLYGKESSIARIMYNDNNETDIAKPNGHAKGVIAADEYTGFWLIHSVPKFPPEKYYSYPSAGFKNGQSFLCITMNTRNINLAAEQLLYNDVQQYNNVSLSIPDGLKKSLPNFVNVVEKKFITNPDHRIINVVSLKGTPFTVFGKTAYFKEDLYAGLVAPTLKTHLYVEVWRCGSGTLMKSDCTGTFHVYNIRGLKLTDFDNTIFDTTKDHSKWAVSQNITGDWICVGDFNRKYLKQNRGGGTVCQRNANVANAYRNLINWFDDCPKSPPKFYLPGKFETEDEDC